MSADRARPNGYDMSVAVSRTGGCEPFIGQVVSNPFPERIMALFVGLVVLAMSATIVVVSACVLSSRSTREREFYKSDVYPETRPAYVRRLA